MSHFTVLVIGEDYEKQLDPFQEEVDSDSPYSEFQDETDEYREQYENETSEMVKLKSGELLCLYDNRFRIECQWKYPEDSEKIEIPFKERYGTFEEFCEDYHCRKPNEDGRYGYYYNPNAKWDWWILGGRWRGFFKIKPGRLSGTELGRPGTFGNKPTHNADSALKGDIDWDGMVSAHREERGKFFDKFFEVLGDNPFPPRWKDIKDKHKDNIELARKEYHNHPDVISFRQRDVDNDFIWIDEDFIDYFCEGDKEKFLEKETPNAFTTFAVLKDGQWYEKGSMGLWGMVSDEKDKDVWNRQFVDLIRDLPDDTLLSVVDCHI